MVWRGWWWAFVSEQLVKKHPNALVFRLYLLCCLFAKGCDWLNQSGSQCLWKPSSSHTCEPLRPETDLIFTSHAAIKCPPLCSFFLQPSSHPSTSSSSSSSALVLCLPGLLCPLAESHNAWVCDAFSSFGTEITKNNELTASGLILFSEDRGARWIGTN